MDVEQIVKTFLLIGAFILFPQLVAAGSQTYQTPGTYTFTVPSFVGMLTVTVNGAGGGGGASQSTHYGPGENGATGGASSFGVSVTGNGGKGGKRGECPGGKGSDGADGSASGGTTNVTGGGATGGHGGTEKGGCLYNSVGGDGGNGGRAQKSYTPSMLLDGTAVSVVVGKGGTGGAAKIPGYDDPGDDGGNGSVRIIWTDPPPNSAPTAPAISGPSTGVVNQSLTYTFTATDSESDTIRYAIDWDNNDTVDELLPVTGYVPSGTLLSAAHSWSTTGTKTFKARTQDSTGQYSGWTSKTITINPPVPTALLTATPTTYREGDPAVTLEWSSSNATSCTGTNFSTGSGSPVSGSTTATPTQTTTYTVLCTGTSGSDSDSAVVTYSANQAPTTPTISGPTNGTEDIPYTFTFTSADPDSDTLRYGVDWNPDTGVDEWVPASGYVTSGTERTASHSWTPGTKTFRALAQDSRGASSGWRTHTITIAPACIPTNVCGADGNVHNSCTNAIILPACQFGCALNACLPAPDPEGTFTTSPKIVTAGGTVTVMWNIEDADTCTVTENNPLITNTWTGTSGSFTSGAITQMTTYTIRCDSFDEDEIADDYVATATVIVTPVFEEQ